MAMASIMVVVVFAMVAMVYVGAVAFAMASVGIDLMSATSNGIDFEHFLVALELGQ